MGYSGSETAEKYLKSTVSALEMLCCPDSTIAETDNDEKHTTIFDYQQGARLMEAAARHLEENDGIQRQ